MDQITITDEQAEIIGQEIGREFAKAFWANIQAGNPNRMAVMSGNYFIDEERVDAALRCLFGESDDNPMED